MIINPDPTSLTESASSVYPNVEKYRNHLKTGGIWLILTKNLSGELAQQTKSPFEDSSPSIGHQEEVPQ